MHFLLLIFIYSNHRVLSRRTNRSDLEATHSTTSAATGHIKITVESIKEICILAKIPLSECLCTIKPKSCDNGTDTNITKPILSTHYHDNLSLPIDHNYFKSFSQIYASVTIICSIIGGAGNAAVLIVACKQRKISHSKMLIALLAASDFTFSVVHFVNILYLFWTQHWQYGVIMCKLIRSFKLLGSLLTIGFILIISIERYLGIVYPLQKTFNNLRLAKKLVVTNIVIAIATISPYFIVLGVNYKTGRCIEMWSGGKEASLYYQWFLILFYFLLPITVISVLYIKIIRHLSIQAKCNEIINSTALREKRIKTNRRIMFIVLSIMIAFIVCTLPNKVIWIYLVSVDLGIDNIDLYMALVYIAYLTYPIRVTLNPIIYSAIDRDWRNDILIALHLQPLVLRWQKKETIEREMEHSELTPDQQQQQRQQQQQQ